MVASPEGVYHNLDCNNLSHVALYNLSVGTADLGSIVVHYQWDRTYNPSTAVDGTLDTEY